MNAGSNPLFGGLKSTKSVFGKARDIWVEGEGMLHALYFNKSNGTWNVVYKNRYVESQTFKLEKQRNKPSFLPATHGDSLAIFLSSFLNWVCISICFPALFYFIFLFMLVSNLCIRVCGSVKIWKVEQRHEQHQCV